MHYYAKLRAATKPIWLAATHVLDPGAVVFMPRGAEHSFTAVDDEPAACLSIMTPPFDGEDRIFADE